MGPIIAGTPRVPIDEAAQELKTTHLRVLMLLKQNALSGCQVEGEWYVEKGSLDCLKQHGIDPIGKVNCATSCNPSACGCKGK